MSLEYWYMLPVSILIATIAMASGVEGGTFFAPVFILALRLSPEVAIGVALITEVFGFASGLQAYARKRLIDYRLGLTLLAMTIPLAALGAWLAGFVEPDLLKVILGVGLFAVAASFLRSPRPRDVEQLDTLARQEQLAKRPQTCLTTAEGEQICYTVCNRLEGGLIAGIGALFMGLVATGLGEMNGYFLLQRCRVPGKVAVATSVFVVAVTALLASTGHFIRFAQNGGEVLDTVLSLIIFTVPGVIIGGQLGSGLASRVSQHTLERGLGVLFLVVGSLTLGTVIL